MIIQDTESPLADAIAIIGMNCRFPGAPDVEAFWSMLKNGRLARVRFSGEELMAAGVPHVVREDPDFVPHGYTIDDIDAFDAAFFGYPPGEAELIDPQQRLYLQANWAALEDAGYPPSHIDARVGVFAGGRMSSYMFGIRERLRVQGSPEQLHALMGNDKDYLASRISYKLNLSGPSMAVQTACSSSLVAVHQACESLNSRECDLALAGGVAVSVPDKTGYLYREGMIYAPDGLCRAFDAEASGAAFGNGLGVVVLKPLETAMADGDHIYAVIRGTAVNNDGAAKIGYTAPSVSGQAAVVREALDLAGIPPETIGYIEAHGTATPLGDAVEIEALTRVFREETEQRGYCAIGSVKTNIGHLEAAAGVASLIKTALMLDRNELVPSINFTRPNPEIDFDASPFRVQTAGEPWTDNGHPRRAGVSSFGIGGTNAHVILEAAPEPRAAEIGLAPPPIFALPLSARTESGVRRQAGEFAGRLEILDENRTIDVCLTAALGRERFSCQRAVFATSPGELIARLNQVAAGETAPDPVATPMGQVCLEAPYPYTRCISLFRREKDTKQMLETLAYLFSTGMEPDWLAFHGVSAYQKISLPTYPFEKTRFWLQDAETAPVPGETAELTVRPMPLPIDDAFFSVDYPAQGPLIRDHQVHGLAIMSGATLMDAVVAVARDLGGNGPVKIREFTVEEALVVPEDRPPRVQVQLSPEAGDVRSFRIISQAQGDAQSFTVHASGMLVVTGNRASSSRVSLETLKARCRTRTDMAAIHRTLYERGFTIGPAYLWLESVLTGDGEALATLRPAAIDEEPRSGRMHPGLIDSCAQLIAACIPLPTDGIFIFLGYETFCFYGVAAGPLHCHFRLDPNGPGEEIRSGAFRLFTDQGRMVAEATGVQVKSAPASTLARTAEKVMGDWLHTVEWVDGPPVPGAVFSGNWLVISPSPSQGAPLLEVIRSTDASAHFLPMAATDAGMAGFEAALHDQLTRGHGLGGILVDVTPVAEEMGGSWTGPLLTALALAKSDPGLDGGIRLVTMGSQSLLPGDRPDPVQAGIWAGFHVLMNESNGRVRGLMDLSTLEDFFAAAAFLMDPPEPRMAVRNGGVKVPRLTHEPAQYDGGAGTMAVDGTWMITGGLGGLGMRLAKWLVDRGVKRLLLLNPSPPDRAVAMAIKGLNKAGAQVSALQVDVMDKRALTRVFETLMDESTTLGGVCHLAGRVDDGFLAGQTPERLAGVIRPKVMGAAHLDQLTRTYPVRHFILFSSISALAGTPGQTGYALANAYLDGLAARRRADGLPALSLNWGAFSDAGMAARASDGARARWTAAGIPMMPPDMGFSLIPRVLAAGHPRAVACAGKWHLFATRMLNAPDDPFFARFAPGKPAGEALDRPATGLGQQLRDGDDSRNTESVEKHLREYIGKTLWIDPSTPPAIDSPIMTLGLDSLMIVELRNQLRTDPGVDIPLALFLKNPDIRTLAREILDALSGETPVEPTGEATLTEIVPDPEHRFDPFPLTDVQHAYWMGSRNDVFDLGRVACHLYLEVGVTELDPQRLETAIRRVIDRHDMLRTVFLADGRQQVLAQVPPYQLQVQDLRGQSLENQANAMEMWRDKMSHQVLPTDRPPLVELRASRLTHAFTRVHLSFDLLVGDGYSFGILINDLSRAYTDPLTPLPEIPVTFRDYVMNEKRSLMASGLYQQSEAYWAARLDTLPPGPDLPLMAAPDSLEQTRFTRHRRYLDKPAWTKIKELAANAGLTASGVLLAAFAEVLAVWSRTPRFTINLTLFNRLPLHPGVGELVGDFTSLTLLEVDTGAPIPFVERAQALQSRLWEDLDHRYVTGVEVLRRKGQAGGSEITQAPVVFTSALPYSGDKSEYSLLGGLPRGMEITYEYSISQTPQVWLDHQVTEIDGALLTNWDAVEGLFPEKMIAGMFDTYFRFLESLADSDRAWNAVRPAVVPEEQLKGLMAANQTRKAVDHRLLQDLFFERGAMDPAALAVIHPEGKLSYGDLAGRVNSLAARLIRDHARPGRPIAIIMEKGWEQVVGVLGILAAGAPYLPIDPDFPEKRIHELILSGGCCQAVVQPGTAGLVTGIDSCRCHVVMEALELGEAVALPRSVPTDLAYVMFTSGSTGTPKGVMIDHQGAVNTVLDINRRFHVGPDDRVFALANLNFDLSVYDIFGTLAAGAAIVMPSADGAKDPDHWFDRCREQGVTVWNSVPPQMQMMLTARPELGGSLLPRLRVILLSGDWIPVEMARALKTGFRDARLVSLGGATEASIWSILHEIGIPDVALDRIPYGRAMDNQTMHVFTPNLTPCPPGIPGEIHIGGIGLARGYHQDPERTAERFVTEPVTGLRYYRTGDLGAYDGDGIIRFLGREDFQVKIRGHRVEIGEIETLLQQVPGVGEGVATWDGRHLTGYVVPASSSDPTLEGVNGFLADRLPEYMMLNALVLRQAFPKTASGKIDRNKLPKPVVTPLSRVPAETGPEIDLLCPIWTSVLQRDAVDGATHFFDAGGDSVNAILLIAMTKEATGADLTVQDLYRNPVLGDFARIIAGGAEDPTAHGVASPDASTLGVLAPGEGTPLVLIHGGDGGLDGYRHLARHLASLTPVMGIRARGLDDDLAPVDVLGVMGRRYARLIHHQCPETTNKILSIAGYCFGGVVAFETARCLREMGREVDLSLINSRIFSREHLHKDQFLYRSLITLFRIPPERIPLDYPDRFAAETNPGRLDLIAALLPADGPGPDRFRKEVAVLQGIITATAEYDYPDYDGDITLYQVTETLAGTGDVRPDATNLNSEMAPFWSGRCRNLTVVSIPGNHYSCLGAYHGETLAAIIGKGLGSHERKAS